MAMETAGQPEKKNIGNDETPGQPRKALRMRTEKRPGQRKNATENQLICTVCY
jgi:hypothetical protein